MQKKWRINAGMKNKTPDEFWGAKVVHIQLQ